MHKLSARRAALIVSAGAVALAGVAAVPAQASSVRGWRIDATFPVRASDTLLTSVDAVSAGDAWSSGVVIGTKSSTFNSLIRHWNGNSWTAVSLPSTIAREWRRTAPLQTVVGASSTANVWIFGGLLNASYLRRNDGRWSIGRLPGGSPSTGKIVNVDAVRVFSRWNVWAFGAVENEATAQPTATPYAAHFNGRRWSVTHVPGNSGIAAVSAASASSIWAVAGTPASPLAGPGASAGQQAVLHWTPGGGWQQPAQPVLPAGAHLSGVLVRSGKVIVGGSAPNASKGRSPLTVTWNGTAWSTPSIAGATAVRWGLASLVPDGRGGNWVLGIAASGNSARLWHEAAGKWTVVKPAFGGHAWIMFQLATVPHSDSVWGAGALLEGKTPVGLMALAGPTPR